MAVATLLPNGKSQFIDQNGVPLVGGFVYFYVPNTSTPKNTWQDAGQITLNTNPIVLDSRGQAIIYGSGQYRQVLQDSAGNVIWDQLTQDLLGILGDTAYENIGVNLKDDGSGNLVSKITTAQDITAASTTDLGTLTSDVVNVNGNTTITSFGSSADIGNPIYFLTFTGSPLLTYNAASLILPSQANIQAVAGDTATAQYLGSGNWKILSYQPISGESIVFTAQTLVPITFRNLKGFWASNTTATFTADQLTLISSFPKSSLINSFNQTLNTATTGAGGLDTGTLTSGSCYYVFAIEKTDLSSNSILFSSSATAPTLPAGYSYSARIGSIRLDNSSNIVGFIQYGDTVEYVVGSNLANAPIVISGTHGDTLVPTWAAGSLTAFVPATAGRIFGYVFSNDSVTMAAPNPNYGPYNSPTNPPPVSCNVGSGIVNIPFNFNIESMNVYYAGGNNAGIALLGWVDNL